MQPARSAHAVRASSNGTEAVPAPDAASCAVRWHSIRYRTGPQYALPVPDAGPQARRNRNFTLTLAEFRQQTLGFLLFTQTLFQLVQAHAQRLHLFGQMALIDAVAQQLTGNVHASLRASGPLIATTSWYACSNWLCAVCATLIF